MEIQRAGEWGTICDDDFTLQAAHVLCRELGFTEATGWTHSAKYGPGTGEQCFRHSLGQSEYHSDLEKHQYHKFILEKEITNHSSIPAWEVPWIQKLGRLQSMGSQRVGHNLATEQQ
mgnify:CR=1 FL=1